MSGNGRRGGAHSEKSPRDEQVGARPAVEDRVRGFFKGPLWAIGIDSPLSLAVLIVVIITMFVGGAMARARSWYYLACVGGVVVSVGTHRVWVELRRVAGLRATRPGPKALPIVTVTPVRGKARPTTATSGPRPARPRRRRKKSRRRRGQAGRGSNGRRSK